jgi:signal transduction histidine kinase
MTPATETLERFELLSGLPAEVLEFIAQKTLDKNYSDGELIFTEGASADHLYLILSGKVSLEMKVQLGQTGTVRRATIGVIGPWQAMGWSSLVYPYEYTASVVCLQDTKVLAIPKEDLRFLISQYPEAGCDLMERVASITRARLFSATSTLTYFLSIVSHELKRPIAAVENYLQITLGGYAGDISDKQRRLLERSAIRLSDLRSLISDILDFARMQPEQIRADFEIVDPLEIGTEAFEEVRLAASQKNIRLKATGPSEYTPIVAAKRRLRQVISNLLANAIKFSPEESTVTLAAHEESGMLVVAILDEGMGIPAKDQQHIFDDFYRASNVEEVSGAGLGLSIAKKIVDAHEGQIEAQSPYESGKSGTKVTIRIPQTLPLPKDRRAIPMDGKVNNSD